MHGWNGQELSVKDYTWNIDYSLTMNMDCEVNLQLGLQAYFYTLLSTTVFSAF